MVTEKISISNRTRNLIVVILALAYIGAGVFSICTSKSIINKPFPGFLVLKNNLVNLLWFPEWEGFKQGIKARDVILAVDGTSVENSDQLYEIVRSKKIDTPLTYTILRGDKELLITAKVSIFTLWDYLICFSIWAIVSVTFMVMGLSVFYLRPSSPDGWSFLLLGATVGFLTILIWEHCTTNVNHAPLYLFPLVGPAALMMHLHFPEPIKIRKYFIAYILFTVPPLIFFYRYSFSNVHFYLKVDTIFLIHMISIMTIGILCTTYSFVTSKDPLTSQKGKIVVYGFIVAFTGAMMTILGALVFKKITFFLIAVPSLLIPFSLGYAIVKHNLFDVDVFIRRTASYLLTSGLALLMFFGAIALLSLALQNISGQSSQIASVVATILIITIFRPIRVRMENFLDRKFFTEKYEYHKTIRKASNMLISIIELESLLNQMLHTILEAMKIRNGIIFLKNNEQEKIEIKAIVEYGEEIQSMDVKAYRELEEFYFADVNHPMYEHLQSTLKPMQLHDIEELAEFSANRDSILRFMHDLDLALVLPIVFEKKLTGLLGLGPKKSWAGYSREDVELLQTLMMQTAVSIENARKVEELKKVLELETSLRELQHVNEMKDNFISMVSHDLRTPMTSIKGYAAFMNSKADKIDKATMIKYSGIIMDETERLTRLVNDILDIQRFEAGRMVLDLQNVDITGLVEESFNVFLSAAQQKSISFTKDIPDCEIMVRANRDRLHQVLANLLSNAIKFTPAEGRVEIKVEKTSDNGKSLVRLSVSDTGPGISKDQQGKLFMKFQQADNMVRKKEEGSGLGLALAREIIEYHGGKVGVESSPGQGSVFYFVVETND